MSTVDQETRDALIEQVMNAVSEVIRDSIYKGTAPWETQRDLDEEVATHVNKRVSVLRTRFEGATTAAVQAIASAPPRITYSMLGYGIDDESLVLDMLLYPRLEEADLSQLEQAIEDVRLALSVDSLHDFDPTRREGVIAALEISIMWRDWNEGETVSQMIHPSDGYITEEFAALILEYPDRINRIWDYVVEDGDFCTVDVDHLRTILSTTTPLVSGVL